MNNEKEIEEMAKAMRDCLYQWDSDTHDLTDSLAEILCEKGHGNVKRAVKEFAQAEKDCLINTTIGHTQEFNDGYNNALVDVKKVIDNLITELYGG